jgi:hypothetical protein
MVIPAAAFASDPRRFMSFASVLTGLLASSGRVGFLVTLVPQRKLESNASGIHDDVGFRDRGRP